MENFLSRIEEGYSRHNNPYHNNLHGADVAQTVHYMLCQTGLMVTTNTLRYYLKAVKRRLYIYTVNLQTCIYCSTIYFCAFGVGFLFLYCLPTMNA